MTEPSFTVGIEEEYLLVDRETRDLVDDPPEAVMTECNRRLEGRVSPEFLKSQIEVGTSKCNSIKDAAFEIAHLRKTVAEVAAEHNLAPIAASTHPFAAWDAQKHTNKERYNILARDMQAVARRLLICGMHVHVGLDDDDLRIDLMGQVAYFLPHILALSTSSPYWRGDDSGLKSYRLAVFDELPRTGLPESFDSWGEYARHLDIMVAAGLVEDASKLWWGRATVGAVSDTGDAHCRCLHAGQRWYGHCGHLSVPAPHALSPKADQSALAQVLKHADPGESLAGPTLWHRRGVGRSGQGRCRSL